MATLSMNNLILSYEELGDPNNPTLVFAHALACDHSHFSEVARRLMDEFHIVSLDLHGHGESGFSGDLSLERMADDCAMLIGTLGLDSVCWIGESMGGMIGMRLALLHPERLGALVLINSSPRPEADEADEARAAMLQMSEGFRAGKVEEVFEAVAPLLFCAATFANKPRVIERYREEFTRPRPREGIYQAALAVFGRGDIASQLHRINVPTLVLSGAHDVTYPLPIAQEIAEAVPTSTLEIVPDSAHMSATEQPQSVAEAIRRFLQTF